VILHVSPNAPVLVRDAASLILMLHIGGGATALASGAAAMILRKGARWHRLAGTLFVMSMLVMAGIGAAVAMALPQRTSVISGVFTLYLVTTGWMTVRRRAGSVGDFELAAAFVALTVSLAEALFGFQALRGGRGLIDGVPPAADFAFATIAALAAIWDFGVIIDGGLFGPRRLARHLWRMGLALFIGTTSLFLGQSQVFPAALRDSPLLIVPPLAVLGLMIFWIARVRLSRPPIRPSGFEYRRESVAIRPGRGDFPPTAGCGRVGTPH
jgi:uncharacterized membrane protein